ncbi:OmpA family protein [Clostridium estertheticum]|uniref:flagellar motor protein MotB n=1 Tax=Clostridium estertheticum TaxID=238834 RepID=UPI001C0B2A68|nr:flagellar motor protein MotB [Clostridium estertheticum]MBU3215560.1 OmpA family protein [Clostridium estertheticum]WAG56822.1 OmpA family protein [Clostridium estertheticum]
MRKKKEHFDEHVDESWLLPYSDMLTLLVALFIVMFAMSQVDKAKLQKLSSQFNIIFSGGSGILQKDSGTIASIDPSSSASPASSASSLEQNTMNSLKSTLDKEISKNGYSGHIKVAVNKDGLDISIEAIALFASGDASVLKNVTPLLLKISAMLKNLDNDIKIAGYTDNKPINNSKFRSNWDLSSIRAINVMTYMVNSGGLNPKNVSIQAYGEYNPKYNNSTEANRAKNRRVEIFVARKYPVATK